VSASDPLSTPRPQGSVGPGEDPIRRAAAGQEWDDWKATLPGYKGSDTQKDFPHPTAVNGLPEGWTIRATRHARGHRDEQHMFLVSCADGGWAAVRHVPPMDHRLAGTHRTILNHFGATFADLYARVCANADEHEIASSANRSYIEMMHEYIQPMYDPDDAAEAAERVLVGLGARPKLMPARLP
jgi:hypothetical protein